MSGEELKGKEAILAALAKPGIGALPPVSKLGRDYKPEELQERFEMEFKALGGEVKTLDDLSSLSEWRTVCDIDVPAEFCQGLLEPGDVWEAEIGLTMADYAIAETGTLVLNSGNDRQRLASLTPPHHVVLVQKSRLLATLDDVFERGFGRSSVLITGPSRTADIEGVLVRGIHGPKRLWVIFFE